MSVLTICSLENLKLVLSLNRANTCSAEDLHAKKVLKDHEISAILRKTYRLELKECAILLANDLGIQPKAAFLSLGFAVPEMQEVRILSA